MSLDRIKQNTPKTIQNQWWEDGVAVDPGTVTIKIDRADGTNLVPAGTATSGSGTNPRTFNLGTSHTGLLDSLTATWSSTLKGSDTTVHEIVGDFLFTIAQAKALVGLTTQTAAAVAEYRTLVETALERACERAFVPRYELATLHGSGTSDLMLKPDPRSIRSVTVDDVAYTAGQLTDLALNPTGMIYNPNQTWTYGSSNVIVGYEHGMAFPPAEVTRAALILTKSWLGGINRPVDDRAITFNATEGGTYSLSVPGRNGSEFGHPDVDVVVQRYGMRVGVA